MRRVNNMKRKLPNIIQKGWHTKKKKKRALPIDTLMTVPRLAYVMSGDVTR